MSRPHRRTWLVALVALAALLLAGTQLAQAAKLSLNGTGRTFAGGFTGRCDTQVTVVPGVNKVTLKDVNTTTTGALASCSGKTAQVWVRSSAGVVTSGSASVSGPSFDVPLASTTPTSAYQVVVLIGGWSVADVWAAPASGCQVVDDDGQAVGIPCTITDAYVGNSWGDPGSRIANMYISFSSTGVNRPNRIRFTLDLSTVTNLPNGWNWATSGTATGGNATPVTGFACSSLPVLVAETPPGWGSYTGVYLQVYENRAGHQLSCS